MTPSVPRLLQRPDTPDGEHLPARPEPDAGGDMDKGDRRTQVPAPKPSEEHEVGDLERSEREDHGRAGREH